MNVIYKYNAISDPRSWGWLDGRIVSGDPHLNIRCSREMVWRKPANMLGSSWSPVGYENDLENMDSSIKKLRDFKSWFGRYIVRSYGKKCPDFTWSCAVCHAHAVKIIFDDFVNDAIATEQWEQKQARIEKPKKL